MGMALAESEMTLGTYQSARLRSLNNKVAKLNEFTNLTGHPPKGDPMMESRGKLEDDSLSL